MRIVTVRIEDNTDKVKEVKELENAKYEAVENISDRIDELQEEGFMQILAYVRCAYEDYIGIIGKTVKINSVLERENTLDVCNITRSLRICAHKDGIFIDFNYAGTLDCAKTPPRMEAKFKDGNIIITKSTRNGIRDLMNLWHTIKPEFQERIDYVYAIRVKKIKSDISELENLLKVAEQFKA